MQNGLSTQYLGRRIMLCLTFVHILYTRCHLIPLINEPFLCNRILSIGLILLQVRHFNTMVVSYEYVCNIWRVYMFKVGYEWKNVTSMVIIYRTVWSPTIMVMFCCIHISVDFIHVLPSDLTGRTNQHSPYAVMWPLRISTNRSFDFIQNFQHILKEGTIIGWPIYVG